MTYDFKKETSGFSITKDGKKISFGSGIKFRAYPQGDTAVIKFDPTFGDNMTTKLEPDVSNDTIVVNYADFSGTASELIDLLRDEVFNDEAEVPVAPEPEPEEE